MKVIDQRQQDYTNEEINEVADWFSSLTIEQIFFLKSSYEAMLKAQAQAQGHEYVH